MDEKKLTEALADVDKGKSKHIRKVFGPSLEKLEAFAPSYNQLMAEEQTEDRSARAKRMRLDIGKVRTEAEKIKKSEKDEYLRAGNAIQGVFNAIKDTSAAMESSLKEIETYYQRIEEERINSIQVSRQNALTDLGVDSSAMDLGKMADDVWGNLLSGFEAQYKAKQEEKAREEAERKAREERERVFRSRRESLAPYARFGALDQVDIEDSEEEFQRLLSEMKRRDEEGRAERARIQAENDRLRTEKEAQEKAKREEAQAKERARLAPDKEKLSSWADALEAKIEDLTSEVAKRAAKEAVLDLRSGAADLEREALKAVS